jgi:hypothetical protein
MKKINGISTKHRSVCCLTTPLSQKTLHTFLKQCTKKDKITLIVLSNNNDAYIVKGKGESEYAIIKKKSLPVVKLSSKFKISPCTVKIVSLKEARMYISGKQFTEIAYDLIWEVVNCLPTPTDFFNLMWSSKEVYDILTGYTFVGCKDIMFEADTSVTTWNSLFNVDNYFIRNFKFNIPSFDLIELKHTKIPYDDFINFYCTKLFNLTTLKINGLGEEIKDVYFIKLGKLKWLKELKLDYTFQQDNHLIPLKNISKLHIGIYTGITGEFLNELKLNSLSLEECFDFKYSYLIKLKNLTTLSLKNTYITSESSKYLKNILFLTLIDNRYVINTFFKELKQLKFLRLAVTENEYKDNITMDAFKFLLNLEGLALKKHDHIDDNIFKLLTKLRVLAIHTVIMSGDEFSGNGIGNLKKLKVFYYTGVMNFSNDSLKAILNLMETNLKYAFYSSLMGETGVEREDLDIFGSGHVKEADLIDEINSKRIDFKRFDFGNKYYNMIFRWKYFHSKY